MKQKQQCSINVVKLLKVLKPGRLLSQLFSKCLKKAVTFMRRPLSRLFGKSKTMAFFVFGKEIFPRQDCTTLKLLGDDEIRKERFSCV